MELNIPSRMIKLRPHHLLCILTYIGKGYSESFVRNFTATLERINEGENTIEIAEGPDDICRPRLHDPYDTDYHCHEQRIRDRDQLALNDLGYDYGDHITITQEWINETRKKFTANAIRSACKNCQWFDLCSKISENNYKETCLG